MLSRKDPQLLALLESELDVRERCGNAVAQVARGELDVALYMDVDPRDIAAPSLLIEEADGRFTDLRGGRSLHTGHALFTSGRHHERLLQLVSAVNW